MSQIVNYSHPTRRRDGDNAYTVRMSPEYAAELEFHTKCSLFGEQIVKGLSNMNKMHRNQK